MKLRNLKGALATFNKKLASLGVNFTPVDQATCAMITSKSKSKKEIGFGQLLTGNNL
jgi:hypothetical protein